MGADRHFLELLEEEDRKEEGAGWAEDDHDEGCYNPEKRRKKKRGWRLTKHGSRELWQPLRLYITLAGGVWWRQPQAPEWEPGWNPRRSWGGRCSWAAQLGTEQPPAWALSSPALSPHLTGTFNKEHNTELIVPNQLCTGFRDICLPRMLNRPQTYHRVKKEEKFWKCGRHILTAQTTKVSSKHQSNLCSSSHNDWPLNWTIGQTCILSESLYNPDVNIIVGKSGV